jgi:hypothetical protein
MYARSPSGWVKSLKIGTWYVTAHGQFGPPSCIWPCVGRVPTRSAPTGPWGGRGPLIGRNGSFPPASEREARMDDPMGLQSPTAGPKERDLWGSRSQARAPSFFLNFLSNKPKLSRFSYWRVGSSRRRTGILACRRTLSTTLSVRREAS